MKHNAGLFECVRQAIRQNVGSRRARTETEGAETAASRNKVGGAGDHPARKRHARH